MNPLNLDSKRFIVAVNASTNGNTIYGWAQLRPIGSTLRNPQEYNALPGSGSIETNIEEEIWQDFENDETEFPNGFASLPWTKEYKDFLKSSQTRLEKRNVNQRMEQKERERIRGQNQLWELVSVYVKPEWRKRGIGRELIRRVMARHDLLERPRGDVYLLTLDRTEDFYRGLGFGFEVTDEPPASMAGEIVVGNLITGFLGSKLVCMRGRGTGKGRKGKGPAPSL